ncbi:MAG: YDG domain-containing protein, partial [Methylobacter sp.]|nr:YDG domain-containing protein [Methylobacter sp.]
AAVTLGDNRVAGDALTLGNTSAHFTDKNAAAGKTVNVSGINVTGTDAGNYTFNTTASTTADITPVPPTPGSTGSTGSTGATDLTPEPVRNVTSQLMATLISTTTSNQPVSYGQSSFSQEMPGSAQPSGNNESQGSGQDAGEQSSPSQSGNTTMTIGDNGSTIEVVNSGVKLPDSEQDNQN